MSSLLINLSVPLPQGQNPREGDPALSPSSISIPEKDSDWQTWVARLPQSSAKDGDWSTLIG